MPLDPRSLELVQGVRPELVSVMTAASDQAAFRITEGLRSKARQKILVRQRKSKTLNSRHITGHAVDFIAIGDDGIATYKDDDMRRVADVIAACAKEQGVKIERGIDWGWDSPHIELDRKTYPANAIGTVERVAEAAKTRTAVGTVAASGATAVTTGAIPIPALPAPPDLSWFAGWQGFGDQLAGLVSWIPANPIATALTLAWVAGAWFWPQIKEGVAWARGSH